MKKRKKEFKKEKIEVKREVKKEVKREEQKNWNGVRGYREIMNHMSTPQYCLLCQYAIDLVVIKLRMLQNEMSLDHERNIISSIISRVKTPESICKKLETKNLELTLENAEENLNDIVGVRATCFFVDDIYEIVSRLSKQSDISILKKKNYIKNPKQNGYQSFHIIINVPVYSENNCIYKKVELQLRTVAMDFWAQLEYQLCYKRDIDEEKRVKIEEVLVSYAKEMTVIDKNMMKLRKEIDVL